MATKSHYPHYDVLAEAEDWDAHTRQIVEQRMQPPKPPKHFSDEEAKTVYQIAATLVDDTRREVLAFVVSHIDSQIGKEIGEADRKTTSPRQADLITRAVSDINKAAWEHHGTSFDRLSLAERQALLGQLERNQLAAQGVWKNLPQKEAFKKLLNLTVEAYYSHPVIWSEIGHGGPAYPRGYIRTEPGLIDSWEAQREEGES